MLHAHEVSLSEQSSCRLNPFSPKGHANIHYRLINAFPRPITALISQVKVVEVVRALVSYKCGWGSDKVTHHPNLPGVNILVWYVILQAGCIYPWKERACVVQLAHSPRPIKIMSLRGDSCSARSNPERILQLKTLCCVEPNNNNMDCRVALAPRNDAKLVVLPTSPNISPDTPFAHFPSSFGAWGEFVGESCELRNSGEGLKNYYFNHALPTPFG